MASKKIIPVESLNVVPGCKVQTINEKTMKWVTVATVAYTPAHINKALKKAKLSGAFVNTAWGREYWNVGAGKLATQQKAGR